MPLVEFFGGYAYARFGASGYTSASNMNGALGSSAWNVKPWLQIVGDASYNFVTASGTKNVLYGNHIGARFFHRGQNTRRAAPFVEALFGGSRLDTTVSGSTTSNNGISYKAGGGLDFNLSPHFGMRLFDVDYYRIPFITNSQNNYWASTGIVLQFGGAKLR